MCENSPADGEARSLIFLSRSETAQCGFGAYSLNCPTHRGPVP